MKRKHIILGVTLAAITFVGITIGVSSITEKRDIEVEIEKATELEKNGDYKGAIGIIDNLNNSNISETKKKEFLEIKERLVEENKQEEQKAIVKAEEIKKAEEAKKLEEAKKIEEAKKAENKSQGTTTTNNNNQKKASTNKSTQTESNKQSSNNNKQSSTVSNSTSSDSSKNNQYNDDKPGVSNKWNNNTNNNYSPHPAPETGKYGYVNDSNKYIHKLADCKFLKGMSVRKVEVSSSGKIACNCWH